MSTIVIVGAGMMGSAMSYPARENGHQVRLVGTPLDRELIDHAIQTGYHRTLNRQLPQGITYYQVEGLQEALKGADLLISGVSSFGVDWFADNVLTIIPEELPVLSITKGMMNTPEGGLLSYPELYAQRLPGKSLSLNAVGGPCISFELADRHHTEVCFCGQDIAALRTFKALLKTEYYHISLSTDVAGVECAVALKNAYALGVTLAVGLSDSKDERLNYNAQAGLFGQSVREMQKILALYGFGAENIYVGAGDLYVTIFGGRTRMMGTLLGSGRTFEDAKAELKGVTLESIVITQRTAASIKAKVAQGAAKAEDFPLLMHIDAIMAGKSARDIPWSDFEIEMVM